MLDTFDYDQHFAARTFGYYPREIRIVANASPST
jgi:hypothetical protein